MPDVFEIDSEDFFRFVSARQLVWYRRQLGWPRDKWTNDPVLKAARFTNAYRALDRGSLFATWGILDQPGPRASRADGVGDGRYDDLDDRCHALEHLLVYRFFNKIETYLDLRDIIRARDNYDDYAADVTKMLRLILAQNRRIYTGAYMATYCPKLGGEDTAANSALVLKAIACEVWENDLFEDLTLLAQAGNGPGCLRRIQRIPGVGHFIGYQMLLDLGFPLLSLGDGGLVPGLFEVLQNWSEAGPGCIKGLGLMGIVGKPCYLPAMRALTDDQGSVRSHLGLDFAHVRMGSSQTDILAKRIALPLSDIENCLCEYSKYFRIRKGGHVKTVYRPEVQSNQGWNPPAPTPPAWRNSWTLQTTTQADSIS